VVPPADPELTRRSFLRAVARRIDAAAVDVLVTRDRSCSRATERVAEVVGTLIAGEASTIVVARLARACARRRPPAMRRK
jgi:hypothetical protein